MTHEFKPHGDVPDLCVALITPGGMSGEIICHLPRAADIHQPDAVNHPDHYGGDTVYEVIKVIDAWGLDFKLGNAVKYIARAGKKDSAKEVEGLKKARFYIDHRIKELEGGASRPADQSGL